MKSASSPFYHYIVRRMIMARINHCAVYGHPEYIRARVLHRIGIMKKDHRGFYVLPPQAKVAAVNAYCREQGRKDLLTSSSSLGMI